MDFSVSFVCDQWWLAKDLGHLSACLQETPVRQDDFAHTDCRGVVKETHDQSLFGGHFAVGLQCFLSGNGSDLVKSFFYRIFGVLSLKKEVDHFLSIFFDVCIV